MGLVTPGWSFRSPQAPCTSLCMSMRGHLFLLSLCREGCKAPGFPGHLVPVEQFRDALLLVAAAAADSLPVLFLWKEQGQSFAPCLVSCPAQPSLCSFPLQQSHLLSSTENHFCYCWQDGKYPETSFPAALSCPFSCNGMQEEVTSGSLPLPADAQYDCIDWAGW